MPRKDIDPGDLQGSTEIQEDAGTAFRVEPGAVGRVIAGPGALPIVQPRQLQTERAGIGVWFAVVRQVVEHGVRVPASVGVIRGGGRTHRQVRPILRRSIDADDDPFGTNAQQEAMQRQECGADGFPEKRQHPINRGPRRGFRHQGNWGRECSFNDFSANSIARALVVSENPPLSVSEPCHLKQAARNMGLISRANSTVVAAGLGNR